MERLLSGAWAASLRLAPNGTGGHGPAGLAVLRTSSGGVHARGCLLAMTSWGADEAAASGLRRDGDRVVLLRTRTRVLAVLAMTALGDDSVGR